jgi:hypothetical protein
MVAQVVVVVGDQDVEHHPTIELDQILEGGGSVLAQRAGKIRIAVPAHIALMGAQQGQPRGERRPIQTVAVPVTVKALDQVNVAPEGLAKRERRHVQAALGC